MRNTITQQKVTKPITGIPFHAVKWVHNIATTLRHLRDKKHTDEENLTYWNLNKRLSFVNDIDKSISFIFVFCFKFHLKCSSGSNSWLLELMKMPLYESSNFICTSWCFLAKIWWISVILDQVIAKFNFALRTSQSDLEVVQSPMRMTQDAARQRQICSHQECWPIHRMEPAHRYTLQSTLRTVQDGWYFANDIFKCSIMNDNFCILIEISLFYTNGWMNLTGLIALGNGTKQVISHFLIQWWPKSLKRICITRPQIIKPGCQNHSYFTYLVQRPKFIAPHKSCLVDRGRAWHPS